MLIPGKNLDGKKVTEMRMSFCSKKTWIFLIGKRGRHQDDWKEADYGSHVENLMKSVDLDELTSFLDHVYLRCTQRECNRKNYLGGKNLTQKLPGPMTCMQRYCQLANKKVEQLYKVTSPCLDDHQFKREELESVGE